MKIILFDFGGTLDTDGVHWSELFWNTYNHFHIPVTKENLKEAFVYSERVIANKIKSDFSLKQTLEKQLIYQLEFLQEKFYLPVVYNLIIDELSEYCYRNVINNVQKSQTLLKILKTHFSLGLVSNYYGNLETVLKELFIREYFSVVIDSSIIGLRKPDQQIFNTAIDNFNADPKDVIVVGDSYQNDIIPAKSIGCYTIWIKNKGWDQPINSENADLTVKSLLELTEALDKLNIKTLN